MHELYSQLQKRQVRVAVVFALFALVRHVILKCGSRLGVVTVKTIENCINGLRPIWRIVEGNAHIAEGVRWMWWGYGGVLWGIGRCRDEQSSSLALREVG